MSYPPVPAIPPHQNSGTHITVSWIIAVLSFGYMLPWAIAATRHKQNTGAIAMLNLFLGWSGVGWIIALVLACLSDPVRPPMIVHHYVQPPYGTPHAQHPATPPPALEAAPAEEFPAYRPPPPPIQGHYPGYQQNPYAELPRYPQASPYGIPSNNQHAFGMNSTDPFSTYPSVEQEAPTRDDGRNQPQ